MDNKLLKDVFEVIIESSDGTLYNYALTSTAALSASVDSELLRGGIGNFVVEKLYASKTWSLSVETVLFNQRLLALQNSAINDFVTGSKEILKTEEHTVQDDGSGGFEIVLDETETIIDDKVDIVYSRSGDSISGTFDSATSTVALTGVEVGDKVTAMFKISSASAETLTLGKKDFPEAVKIHLHSITYVDGQKDGDIYITLDKCSPSGNVEIAGSAGNNSPTTVDFDVLASGDSYGTYTYVPVA